MVFHFLAGLFSLLTSSLVYIIGAVVFSKDLTMAATFILALIVLSIIVGLARAMFSPSGYGLKSSMSGMLSRGYSLRSMAHMFKRSMERQIISGSVARVIAFGTILFIATNNMMMIYVCAAVAGASGLILMLAHRHHFVDLVSGAIIGCGVGLLSWKFTPLILSLVGF